MYKILSFSVALLFLLSCKRNEEQTYISDPTRPQVRVSGLLDITVQRTPFRVQQTLKQFSFLVKQEYGNKKNVNLDFENLPVGITASLDTKSGVPDFLGTANIFDQGVAAGDYQPSLLVTQDGSELQRYPFRLKILGDTVCGTYFLNKNWTATSACNYVPGPSYSIQVTRFGASDSLLIDNFDNGGNKLKVLLNCGDTRVQIPTQTIGGKVFEGYGGVLRIQSPTYIEHGGPYPNAMEIRIKEVGSFNAECIYTYLIQ